MTELPVILIADDDPDLRRLVRMYLESSEYALIEANSGTDALEKILVECPDLVILDVMMPGMTGWEILRYLRTKSGYADIAVLMLTGIGAALNEMSSPMYGADDYLDTFGDSSVFGKSIGGDIVNNKKSWLMTRALEKGGEMEKSGVIDPSNGKKGLLDAMDMNIGDAEERNAKIERVKGIYETLGIDEDAKYEIIKLHAQAMDYAGMIGLSKVRYEMLHRYADKLVGRTK